LSIFLQQVNFCLIIIILIIIIIIIIIITIIDYWVEFLPATDALPVVRRPTDKN